MTTPDRYAELRKQYPDLPDWYWDAAAERRAADQALHDLHGKLAHLVGYHGRDGAVPIEKIRGLVPGLSEEEDPVTGSTPTVTIDPTLGDGK